MLIYTKTNQKLHCTSLSFSVAMTYSQLQTGDRPAAVQVEASVMLPCNYLLTKDND